MARPLASTPGPTGDGAAYLAGLAADKLNRNRDAERYLLHATNANDPALAGDAGAALGLIYSQQKRFTSAVRVLEPAAKKLSGEDRAKAFFYLGAAQQKLGRIAEARTSFRLSLASTQDPALKRRIEQQRATSGWTVQAGAYREMKNAQAAAAALTQRVRGASPLLVHATDSLGRPLILLRIGQFTTHSSATTFARQLGQGAVVVPLSK